MKSFLPIGLLALLAMVKVDVSQAAPASLLPGLSYYTGKERLTGKLVFLLRHDYTVETNSENAASIYEFNFGEGRLRKVTEAPAGLFIASDQGDVFCVIFWHGIWIGGGVTNAFIYSLVPRQSRSINLECQPKNTVLLNGHAFFELQISNDVKLMDYDITRDEKRIVALKDASLWQYQDYGGVRSPPDRTNIVHFHYNRYG